MNIKLIKGHDGPEKEEGEVEVVLEQLQDVVVSIFPLAVLQSKAHAAHYSKPTTSIEENMTQVKVPLHKTCLHGVETGKMQHERAEGNLDTLTHINIFLFYETIPLIFTTFVVLLLLSGSSLPARTRRAHT